MTTEIAITRNNPTIVSGIDPIRSLDIMGTCIAAMIG